MKNDNKVLHLITGLRVGGAEASLLKLLTCCKLGNDSHKIVSLTPYKSIISEKIEMIGVEIVWLKFDTVYSIVISLIKLVRVVWEFKPKVIQGWMYHANVFVYLISFFIINRNPRIIWNIRHTLNDFNNEKITTKMVIKLSALLSNRVDCIVYNSKVSYKSHIKYGFIDNNSTIIHNGFVETSNESVDQMRKLVRKKWSVGEDIIVIGHLARYHKIKGHICFIKGLCSILDNFKNIKVVMAGEGVSKSNKEIVENIPSHHLASFIFLEQVKDPVKILSGLDVFCQTSLSEAFPNALSEAMSLGVFSIASNVGETEYIIGSKEYIFLPNAVESFVKLLSVSLKLSEEERQQHGATLRNRIFDLFSIGRVCEKYHSILFSPSPSSNIR